jgi:hypothetical protein
MYESNPSLKGAREEGIEPPYNGFEDRGPTIERFSQAIKLAEGGVEPPSTGNEPGELPLLHPARYYVKI